MTTTSVFYSALCPDGHEARWQATDPPLVLSCACPVCPSVSLTRAQPLVAAPVPVVTASTASDGYGWLRGGANTVREAYAAFMGRA